VLNRRKFLKTAAAAGGAAAAAPVKSLASRQQDSTGFFGLHDFIENHPEAVFIMKTNVDVKTDSEAIKGVGLEFSRSVFVPKDSGIPLTHTIPIKPNLTCSVSSSYPLEHGMGIVTDAFFVEGLIEGMKELGMSGDQFHMREVNCPDHFGPRGYYDLAERTGADIRDTSAKVGVISENDLVWVDTPDGVWYRKIPYLWPINAPDTWLINIAKFKAHGMGLTLCAKNIQGGIAHNYQAHCSGFSMDMDMVNHKNPNAITDIKENQARHQADCVPRWDKPGTNWNSGLGMETWASRCLDNNQYTPVGLHIIEGIYGRDGNFQNGPHLSDGGIDLNNKKGLAKDFMSNIIIFGKNAFKVDIIGHWLGGHEPGNMGYLHMAIDRGLNDVLDPFGIPVYEWKNGAAVMTPLTEFPKTELLTYYLQRNWDGQTEPYWHLVNEPFDYGTVKVEEPYLSDRPEAFVLSQNRPNPFNPDTAIEYTIPESGNARLEIYNAGGQLIDVLVDGFRVKGAHMATWRSQHQSTGVYFYRFTFNGHSETKKMMLLK